MALMNPETQEGAKSRPFGYSVLVDMYGVYPECCGGLDFNYRALTRLAAFIKMEVQSPPFLFRSPVPDDSEKAGLTGFLPLIESGIAIHTLENKGFVTIDVYTCGEVTEEKVVEFLRSYYSPTHLESKFITRGESYGK